MRKGIDPASWERLMVIVPWLELLGRGERVELVEVLGGLEGVGREVTAFEGEELPKVKVERIVLKAVL